MIFVSALLPQLPPRKGSVVVEKFDEILFVEPTGPSAFVFPISLLTITPGFEENRPSKPFVLSVQPVTMSFKKQHNIKHNFMRHINQTNIRSQHHTKAGDVMPYKQMVEGKNSKRRY